MRALRFRLFQETACYKKPFAFKVGETYPLPPYSTVKGWLHALLGAQTLIPMHISIQGDYEGKILDYQAHYFIKSRNSNELPLVMDGLSNTQYDFKDMTQMPLYVHLLYNVQLVIHVVSKVDVLEQLKWKIENLDFYQSLGRWEDLVRIDGCRFVDLSELRTEKIISNNVYIPLEQMEHYLFPKTFIPYRLNWIYEIRNDVRKWSTVDVGYVPKGISFEAGEALMDDDGELVFLFPTLS